MKTKVKAAGEITDRLRYVSIEYLISILSCIFILFDFGIRTINNLFFYIIFQGSRKRPRLEKGQESGDGDLKKEDDIKSEIKGNKKRKKIFFHYL